MTPLKIVYISRSIIPSRTANSVNVVRMCSAFASLGHDVTLLVQSAKKLEEKEVEDIFTFYGVEKNFKIKKLFSPNIKFLRKKIYAYRCLNQVKKINPDIVYGRGVIEAFYLTQKAGYKTLFERHSNYNKDKRTEEKIFKRFILENTHKSKLVTIAQKLKKIYCKEYNIKESEIHVAPSATTICYDFDTIPETCNKYKDSFNVGYIGKVAKNRGLEIIISLAAKFPKIIFHIIGGNDKEIIFWKSKAENLRNIVFHGFVHPTDTYKYRNLCDILLAPYIDADKNFEYMSPLKIFEYMASKTPIICSDSKIIRETIDEKYAILADNKDISTWIEAIEKLHKDIEFREQLTNSAYEYCIKNFTYEARCKEILEFGLK